MTIWTAWEAPRRHHRGRKGPFGQAGRIREAPGNPVLRESCSRQSCAPSGLLKASLCYGQPAVGPTPGFAANRAVRH